MCLCKIAKDDNFTLSIKYDADAEDPREGNNLGKMICWHPRYALGDKHEFKTTQDLHNHIRRERYVILPIYLIDHTTRSVRTKPFNVQWDSGQVGFIYVTNKELHTYFGVSRIQKNMRRKALEILEAEVVAYDRYLRGDVYGYVLEDAAGEEIDSGWGYSGLDAIEAELPQCLPPEAVHLVNLLQFEWEARYGT